MLSKHHAFCLYRATVNTENSFEDIAKNRNTEKKDDKPTSDRDEYEITKDNKTDAQETVNTENNASPANAEAKDNTDTSYRIDKTEEINNININLETSENEEVNTQIVNTENIPGDMSNVLQSEPV